jgi:hypothetical protein
MKPDDMLRFFKGFERSKKNEFSGVIESIEDGRETQMAVVIGFTQDNKRMTVNILETQKSKISELFLNWLTSIFSK